MPTAGSAPRSRRLGAARIVLAASVLAIIAYAYLLAAAEGAANPFDYFGYFTNLTGVLSCGILLVCGVLMVAGSAEPEPLMLARAVATACMLVVGVVYNVLVPGTGSAPPWVSTALHVVLPALVALDWLLLAPPKPPRWRKLWVVLPYPVAWLAVVLVMGATDGWVPYGFLLPDRGVASLLLHVSGLLLTLIVAGALVWGSARFVDARRRSFDRGRPAPQPVE